MLDYRFKLKITLLKEYVSWILSAQTQRMFGIKQEDDNLNIREIKTGVSYAPTTNSLPALYFWYFANTRSINGHDHRWCRYSCQE